MNISLLIAIAAVIMVIVVRISDRKARREELLSILTMASTIAGVNSSSFAGKGSKLLDELSKRLDE